MSEDNKLEMIDLKKKKLKKIRFLNIFISSVLSLLGTVSLVSMLMFLNNRFGVSYFSCLMLSLFLPSIYSSIINSSLEFIDKKIRNIQLEIKDLEDEYNKNNKLTKESIIKNIEIRFEGLSREKKKELLNYMKDRIPENSCYDYVSKLEDNDSLSLLDDFDSKKTNEEDLVYSKKRNINDEFKR